MCESHDVVQMLLALSAVGGLGVIVLVIIGVGCLMARRGLFRVSVR